MVQKMSVSEIAEWLKVERTTVWTWINDGKLPNARKNEYAATSPYSVPVSDVVDFLKSRGIEAPPMVAK